MYDRELKFLEQNISLIEEHKVEELYAKKSSDISWSNVLKICYSPEINIDLLEGATEIPSNFFNGVDLSDIDLIIPASIKKIEAPGLAFGKFKSIKFANPDCKVFFYKVTAEKIQLPENSILGKTIILESVAAEVWLSKMSACIPKNSIRGYCSRLKLAVPKELIASNRIDNMYTRSNSVWSANRSTLCYW